MDRNLLLAFALSFLVLSLWSMMQPKPPPRTEGTPAAEAPAPTEPGAGRYPELSAPQPAPAAPTAPAAQGAPAPEPAPAPTTTAV